MKYKLLGRSGLKVSGHDGIWHREWLGRDKEASFSIMEAFAATRKFSGYCGHL
jgi:hypothetical protein